MATALSPLSKRFGDFTKRVPVTYCPPRPAHIIERPEFAFAKQHHQQPVSAESDGHGGFNTPGISFEDFSRMTSTQRKTTGERRLKTPSWAVTDKELQHVLVVFLEERAGFIRKRQPLVEKESDLTREGLLARLAKAKAKIMHQRDGKLVVMKKLNEEYHDLRLRPDASVQRLVDLETEIQGLNTYLRISENGTVDIVCAIVYLYYRAGMDSVGVAAELGVKPPHVRQTLWRLHRSADHIAGVALKPIKPKPPKPRRQKPAPVVKLCSVCGGPLPKCHRKLCAAPACVRANKKKNYTEQWKKNKARRRFCSTDCREAGKSKPAPVTHGFGVPMEEARQSSTGGSSYESYLDVAARSDVEPMTEEKWRLGLS
jgi:hypothetical protein